MKEPEDVFRAAYASLAAGAFDELLTLLDEESLQNVRNARLQVAKERVRRARRDATEWTQFRSLLESWGVSDEQEIAQYDAREIARRGLAALPAIRRTVTCQVVAKTLEDPNVATITFRLGWRDAPLDTAAMKTARLRRSASGWRIQSSLLNPWLLPGFENVLFFEGTR